HALEREQLQNHIDTLETALRDRYDFANIVGAHPKMVDLLELVGQVAGSDASVLIQGESGTGKELIAEALHFNSHRKDKPFVALNCGALPAMTLESELFGHAKGAFTGAIQDKDGWFEKADGGTIFFDEVSEMPKALQVKLLRVLQKGKYAKVGSTAIQTCDVRVVAATNKNLKSFVEKKRFRQDLYYRLNVFEIYVPPLRERREDIPLLARHFLDLFAPGKIGLWLSSEAESLLMAYDYPGNVRELENIIQRAVILARGDTIEPRHLPPDVCRTGAVSEQTGKISPFKIAKQRIVEAFEREYLADCLRATQGNISAAARIAGIDVKNFHQKIRAHRIDPGEFKKKNLAE
ncbi:MAG: sigma-54 interaction domain-containing protein, partial [bacterium]